MEKMLKRISSFALLTWFLLYLSSCKTLSSPPIETQYEIDGQWAGYTDQKQIIAFTIENHQLTYLEIKLWKELDCTDSELRRFSPESPAEIKGNSITAGIYEDTLSATFKSSTEASGTFQTYGGLFGDHGCLGDTTFRWNAMRQVLPDTTQCASVSVSTTAIENSEEPIEFQTAPDGACIEVNGVKSIKYAIGSRITPSLDRSAYWIWIPERETIMTLNGWWGVIARGGAALRYKDDQIWMPEYSLPVMKWDGEFFVALVDFGYLP